MRHRKSEVRNQRFARSVDGVPREPEIAGAGATGDGRVLVTRSGLAVALAVSLRTVDRMLAAGEIKPVRMRGWSVRFYVPDVVECLRNENRKWGRQADYRTTGMRTVGPKAGGSTDCGTGPGELTTKSAESAKAARQ